MPGIYRRVVGRFQFRQGGIKRGVEWDTLAKTRESQDISCAAPAKGRYVLLRALSEVTGGPWASAAEIGVERASRSLGDVPTAPGAEVAVAATDVVGSSVNAATGAATERYETTTRYRGSTQICPGSSSGKVHSFHFEVESVGTAARGAISTHTQGVYLCNPVFGQ